jgi:hypothetical protein
MELLEGNNGVKGAKTEEKSEEKPKKNRERPEKRRYLPSLPSAISAADMNTVEYSALADRTAVEWSSLQNYEMFSLAADGSFPMIKVSRSKAVRIADRQVLMVGSGRCFRVSLSNHPTQKKPQSLPGA